MYSNIKSFFILFLVITTSYSEGIGIEKIMVEEKTLFENNPKLENLKDFNLVDNNNANIVIENMTLDEYNKLNQSIKTPIIKEQKQNNNIPIQKNQPVVKIYKPAFKQAYSNEPLALAWSMVGNKKIANMRFAEKTVFLKENEKYNNYKLLEINKNYIVLETISPKSSKKYYYKDSFSR